MSRIGKQAEFYRGYLADDRSLAPVAGGLLAAIAIWLLFYLLVSLLDPAPNAAALASAPGADQGCRAAGPWTESTPHGRREEERRRP